MIWLEISSFDGSLDYIEKQRLTKKAKVRFDFRFLFCAIGAHSSIEPTNDTENLA